MFKIGNHLVCHFDPRRGEKSLNTVSCKQRSEGFLFPLRSIRYTECQIWVVETVDLMT